MYSSVNLGNLLFFHTSLLIFWLTSHVKADCQLRCLRIKSNASQLHVILPSRITGYDLLLNDVDEVEGWI